MNPEQKISPAFEAYLADSKRRDKYEAVVIYQAPQVEISPSYDRTHVARAQAAAHTQIANRIHSVVHDMLNDDFRMSRIGGSALPALTVELTPAALYDLAKQPDVVAIMPNQRINLIQPEFIAYEELHRNEARLGVTWGLEHLEIPNLWSRSRGRDISVGVLDTGVYGNHPALNGRVRDFVVIDPLGRRISAAPMFDGGIHGTHVCGTIAGGRTPEGVAIGVAPEADLYVAGVLMGDSTLRTLFEGIDWAVEKGVDIINMSLGFNYHEPMFTKVFEILIDQYEILPVVSVGNEYLGNSSSPGNSHNALAVGAVEKMGRNKVDVAFFSSGASLVFPTDEENKVVTKPDVVAPGVQVFSCIPPMLRPGGAFLYTYMNGTSMASPHVAGLAALLMGAHPKASVPEIVQAIKETSRHPGGEAARPDNRWGYGLIDPKEAMAALCS
ncbi:MAG: S8 family serine peptidase [Litorilinea sp.]